jgi:Putative transposase
VPRLILSCRAVPGLQEIFRHGESATPALCGSEDRGLRTKDRSSESSENEAGGPPQLNSAYRDGTTYVVISPLEFMQSLAALVPRPRVYLIRFHSVLAPNSKLRSEIIPGPLEKPSEHAAHHAHGVPAQMS